MREMPETSQRFKPRTRHQRRRLARFGNRDRCVLVTMDEKDRQIEFRPVAGYYQPLQYELSQYLCVHTSGK